MFDISTTTACLQGLIGFEASYNADIEALDADLRTSESGLYVNNTLHPLLTYENIKATAEHFSIVNVRAWSNTARYKKNDIVKDGETVYRSLVDANLNNAVTDATKWAVTNLLSAYLRRLYEGATTKLLNRVFTEKKLGEAAKTLLTQLSLYEGVGNISGRITKNSRLVGLRLTMNHADTMAVLTHLGLQVDTAQTLHVYLYHTSSNTYLERFELVQTKSVQFQWHAIAQKILSFKDETVNAGGNYYLCYYEDDLTGAAIKKDISWAGRYGCQSCSEARVNTGLHQKWSRFVGIQPFYVNGVDLPGDNTLWDEEKEIHVDDTTFGLNLQLHVKCDVSPLICASKSILADALSRQITVDLLQEMTYSQRDNQTKQKVAALAAVALDNQENGQPGEVSRLEKAVKAVSFDLSNINSICLPCDKQRKARMGSVWR